MMTVTEEARTHLATVLDTAAPEEGKADSCLRIVRKDDQIAMVIGQKQEADAVVEHDGKPVLAVPPDVATMLEGRTLDVQPDDDGQPRLAIK